MISFGGPNFMQYIQELEKPLDESSIKKVVENFKEDVGYYFIRKFSGSCGKISCSELSNKMDVIDKMLTDEFFLYINSLVDLEISALKIGVLPDEVIKEMTQFDGFRKIVLYNVYNRSIKFLENLKNIYDVEFLGYNSGLTSIQTMYTGKSGEKFSVFDLSYKDGYSKIKFERLHDDPECREKRISLLREKLDLVEKEKNPYSPSFGYGYIKGESGRVRFPKIGGSSSFWSATHDSRVKTLKNLIAKLENFQSLTDKQIHDEQVKEQIRTLFLNDCGLTIDDFEVVSVGSKFLKDFELTVDDFELAFVVPEPSNSCSAKTLTLNRFHTTVSLSYECK